MDSFSNVSAGAGQTVSFARDAVARGNNRPVTRSRSSVVGTSRPPILKDSSGVVASSVPIVQAPPTQVSRETSAVRAASDLPSISTANQVNASGTDLDQHDDVVHIDSPSKCKRVCMLMG